MHICSDVTGETTTNQQKDKVNLIKNSQPDIGVTPRDIGRKTDIEVKITNTGTKTTVFKIKTTDIETTTDVETTTDIGAITDIGVIKDFGATTKDTGAPKTIKYENLKKSDDDGFENANCINLSQQRVGLIIVAQRHGTWWPCKY